MKIAIVTETFLPSTDGVVKRMVKALDYIMPLGEHEVLVIAPGLHDLPDSYKGAKIVGVPVVDVPFYDARPWSLPTGEVKNEFLAFQPDLVHAVNPISLGASAVYYSQSLDIPLICSFHTNIPNYLDHYHLHFLKPIIWPYLRKLHNVAKINLVTSQAMYDLLDENRIERLEILPKGVDLDHLGSRFYSEEMRDLLSQGKKDKKILLFVGRLAPEKNVQSLKELLDERKDICLAVVGDGPAKKELEEVFQDYPVVFTGYLHGEELSSAFASADAFIFPSQSETLGLVITEAMASSLPVIAATSPPSLEQIEDGKNGLIYDPDVEGSLSNCIDKLYDQELYQKLKKESIAYASQFSWDYAGKAMLDAYIRAKNS